MMKKTGAEWLCFLVAVCLCGVGVQSRGAEGVSGVSTDKELAADDAVQRRLSEVKERLAQLDRQQGGLEEEEQGVQSQLRSSHRDQYALHQQILESDTEAQNITERIATLQKELIDAQEELTQHMATRPEYVESQTRQTAAMDRVRAIQRDRLELANEQVRLQMEQKTLEKQLAALAADTLPEAAVGGIPPATEEAIP